MNLEEAKQAIAVCAGQMNNRYRKIVFDEWAIVSMGEKQARLLAYFGPRKEGFQQNFLTDAGQLRQSLLAQQYPVGDFEFARDGVGTGFEAFVVLGDGVSLICNNTVQSMDGITRDPLWLGAQVPFVELSDRFRSDPLVVRA